MHSSLQKKSLFSFVLFALLTIFCLGFLIDVDNTSYAESGSVEDFYRFEDEFLKLVSEEEDNGLSARSFSKNNYEDEDSVFALKRLIVIGEIDYYYGATSVIDGYKNYNILAFDSEEDTEQAYNQLSKNEDLIVIVDQKIYIDDYADNNYTYPTQGTWGAEVMNTAGINDYLTAHGTDEDVVVVVLDTGIRPTHIFFEDRLIEENGQIVGYSYYQSNALNQQYDFEDDNGHGSHVSGIITQLTPTNVKILPIKVLNSAGSGNFSNFIVALERVINVYSNQYNICCVNMSLGGGTNSYYSNYFDTLFNELRDKNILPVVSAGNDQLDVENYTPANSESAIVVSALKEDDDVVSFDHSYSNFGSTVDISAPGTEIFSAYYTADNMGAYMSGTSMASPHVSAAVALLCCDEIYWQGAKPTYTDDIIEARLYENTLDLGDKGWDEFYGNGMVDLKYFNVDCSQDVLTFKNNNKEIDTTEYIQFEGSYRLTVQAPSGYQVYYTTDGTIPTRNSNLYSTTLTITHSDIYYFMAYDMVGGSITGSSILYKVDMFNPNDDIDGFFTNDNGTLTSYTGHFSELVIPSIVDGRTVTALDARLFNDNEIEVLTLPSTCLTIGEYCFSDCVNLRSIEISGVTKICAYAFQNCQSLSEIETKKVERLGEEKQNQDVLGHVFEGCTSLKEVYLPKLITIGEESFYNSGVTMVAIGRSLRTTYGEGVGQGITVYGYEGSTAEDYCDNFGNEFVAIEPLAFTSNLPMTKEIERGDDESLKISANGLKLSYQWYTTSGDTSNGEMIEGQTQPTFTLQSLELGTTKYYVVVTDWEDNTITSNICKVTVKASESYHVAQIYTQSGWQYFTTIELALDSAVDGDIIVVTQDCYLKENILIDKNITLLSANNSTIYIHEDIQETYPAITIGDGASLAVGYFQTIYQGLRVTSIYIDGQSNKNSIDTLFLIKTNATLTIETNAQLQNVLADSIIDGESGSNLTINGKVVDSSTPQNNDNLISASNVNIGGGATLQNLIVQDGAILYVNNGNLTIDNANFDKNNAKNIVFAENNSILTLNDGNFTENNCQSLIYVSLNSNSQVNLLGGSSSGNISSIEQYYDIVLTDSDADSLQENCVQIDSNCKFGSFYIDNSTLPISLTVVESLSEEQIFNIEMSDETAYLKSPIIILKNGANIDLSQLKNSKYEFVNRDGMIYLQEKPDYTLTYVLYDDVTTIQTYKAGESIAVIASPQRTGYNFVGWYQEKDCINEYIFTVMPEDNVTVYAKWQIMTYCIYATSDGNGQISPSGEVEKEYNTSQTFTFIPDKGYHVSAIIVDGVRLSGDALTNAIKDGYTFVNIDDDHQIRAQFAIDQFTIDSLSSGNGIISPTGERVYSYGQNATYIILPNRGYHIESIFVDDKLIDEEQYETILEEGYTFENIDSSHTIEVNFAINVYFISSYAGENGQISPDGRIEIEYGKSQTYLLLPDTGYHVQRVVVDSEEVSVQSLDDCYTFLSVTENHTIEVYFEVTEYQITYDLGYDNENVDYNYDYNSQISPYVPSRKGYDFLGWYKDSSFQEKYDFSTMPAENFTLYAKWQIKTYQLDYSFDSNGEIVIHDSEGNIIHANENGTIERNFNTNVTYYVLPKEGYYILSITVDGQSLSGSEIAEVEKSGYTFANIEDSHNFEVDFEIYKFQVNVLVEGNGRFYCSQDLTSVEYGDDRVFRIDTDYDKNRIEIYVNGSLVDSEESNILRVSDIEQNMTISVRFIERPFFETESGKIVIIVLAVVGGIIIVSVPITIFIRRRRLYSDMDRY